jgi:nicotinamidase-related amidase
MTTGFNSAFNPAAYRDPGSMPVLVLIDMQQEYLADGRLPLPGIEPALDRCRAALAHARSCGLPVAWTRWVGRSPFFHPGTRFARWIEGFQPHGCDMIFDRDRPSAYASPAFADVMERSNAPLVIAGFAGEAACLATAVEAFHRGQRLIFLDDASASHALAGLDGTTLHRAASAILGAFGEVMETSDWIASFSSRNREAMRG